MRKTLRTTYFMPMLMVASLLAFSCGGSDGDDDDQDLITQDQMSEDAALDVAMEETMEEAMGQDGATGDMLMDDSAEMADTTGDMMMDDTAEMPDATEDGMMGDDMMPMDAHDDSMSAEEMMEEEVMEEVMEMATFDLSFSGMAYSPHNGNNLYVALVDQNGMSVVAADSTVVADGLFSFAFPGALMEGASYYVDYFADFNDSGVCDAPPSDHVWRIEIEAVSDHVELEVSHNTDFEPAACASFDL
jgi:hypothetical protein